MTDLEVEQRAQLTARAVIGKADKAKCEAIDFIPRTLFTTGAVFLSILVPLQYGVRGELMSCKKFACAASISMVVCVVSSAMLFFRTIRMANETIEQMHQVVQSGMWKEPKTMTFRWWDYCFFVVMGISFLCAIVLLVCSFVQA